jgi:hypothetical protein
VLVEHTLTLAQHVLALAPPAPTPTPTDAPINTDDVVHTEAIVAWFVKFIGPLLMLFVGVIIFGRGRRGRVSEVMTTSGISIVGIMFMVGGVVLFTISKNLVHLMFG